MEPEIHNPLFFYRGHRFEGVVGVRNDFQHTFGASRGFTVNGQPAGKRGLHQLLTLDTREAMRSQSSANDSLWVRIGGEGFATRVREGLLEIKAESSMLGYLNAPSPFTRGSSGSMTLSASSAE